MGLWNDIKNAVEDAGEAVAKAAKKAGEAIAEAAKAVGEAVASAVSAVGDAVEKGAQVMANAIEGAVDAVFGTIRAGLEAASEWVCKNAGKFLCWAANLVFGLLDGLVRGIQELFSDLADILRDLGRIVGSLLRLDLPGLIRDLGRLVVDVLDLAVDTARLVTGGYAVGGVVRHRKRSRLIGFVEDLVKRRFGGDADLHERVRREIGLEGRRFGFRLPAEHRVFVMDSQQVPLWQMHERGEIDLYAMAHLLSFDSFSIGTAHPNTLVEVVRDDGEKRWWPVNRLDISTYLESRGSDRRLRVYAMDRQAVAQRLKTANRKLEEIGVVLRWNGAPKPRSSWFEGSAHEIEGADYTLRSDRLQSYLAKPDLGRAAGENCSLLALGTFILEFVTSQGGGRDNGRVAGRSIRECGSFPANCPTPDRTDRCCNLVRRTARSGVVYRDIYPRHIFQYVLAHEIGHFLGLCHCGHDGFQNVMFSLSANRLLSPGLGSFYHQGKPHFTLEDGKNAWRFILHQLESCLTGQPASTTRTRRQPLAETEPESCAVPPAADAGEEPVDDEPVVSELVGEGSEGREP